MANCSLVRVVVVCLAMFSVVVGLAPRRKPTPKAKDALYNCLVKQNCECQVKKRFEDCWEKLAPASRDWIVDGLNQCENNVALQYGTFKGITDLMCPQGDSINKPCYDAFNPKLMERAKQAGSGQLGEEETIGFELARKCIEPNLIYCNTFQDCMSEG